MREFDRRARCSVRRLIFAMLGGWVVCAAPVGVHAQRAGQVPAYATRQTVFAIPFSIDRQVERPVEIHLYVSTDRGNTWQLSARQSPTARQFTFRSTGDGEYLFASRTLDGSSQAAAVGRPQAEMRIIVDTRQPKLEFQAQPMDDGSVQLNWRAADEHLVATSIKVEYQEALGQSWNPIALAASRSTADSVDGQTTWWPKTQAATVNLRAEIRDRAGNLATAQRRLLLPSLVPQAAYAQLPSRSLPDARPSRMDPSAYLGTDDRGLTGRPGSRDAPRNPNVVSNGAIPWPSGPSDRSSPPQVPTGSELDPSGSNALGKAAPFNVSEPSNRPTGSDDRLSPTRHASSDADRFAAPSLDHRATTIDAVSSGPSSTRSASADVSAGVRQAELPSLPTGERPQMTNAKQFQLDYTVDSIGPAGPAEVQLWATEDGGQTWRLWGTDDDKTSPMDVDIQRDGTYGFHVVVVAPNGLTGRKPRSGDVADLWVGVDTKRPTAQLISARYGTGEQAGKLLIRWQANDAALDARPVTLLFSQSDSGPWQVIASALPNQGQYAWPSDPSLPESAYLRLEVRDQAGNVATDQSEEVQLDGLAPRATIRGIAPIPDADREAFRRPQRG